MVDNKAKKLQKYSIQRSGKANSKKEGRNERQGEPERLKGPGSPLLFGSFSPAESVVAPAAIFFIYPHFG